jgi:hypothetical protein
MSADNTIVILATTSSIKQVSGVHFKTRVFEHADPPIVHYRVAHVQNFEDYDWFAKDQPYNVGAWLYNNFKDSPIFTNKDDALVYAREMYHEIEYVEYGISFLDATQYHLLGE